MVIRKGNLKHFLCICEAFRFSLKQTIQKAPSLIWTPEVSTFVQNAFKT